MSVQDGKDGEGASPALLKITVMRGRDLLAKVHDPCSCFLLFFLVSL